VDADVIVIGAGLIGLALARDLHRRGLHPLVLEAQTPARQASWAGAGMLAGSSTTDPALRALAVASARLYPTWIRELEAETGCNAGYRPSGTLFLATAAHPAPSPALPSWEPLSPSRVIVLEPNLEFSGPGSSGEIWRIAGDHSVDNRLLGAALLASLRANGVELRERVRVSAVASQSSAGLSVETSAGTLAAPVVVNCAGAWAGEIAAPVEAPIRPRKGQMLSLRGTPEVRHVLAAEGVYLVPRAGGRLLVGATLEDCGFDASLDPAALSGLRRRADSLVRGLDRAEVEESWVGFRPCSPDEKPLLGPTACPGYWLATGHFRDGILLAPITAKIVASAIAKGRLTRALDLAPFAPARFH
jgi:glycine oxidase ThiO